MSKLTKAIRSIDRKSALLAVLFLSLAVWLLFPFIHINAATVARSGTAIYRLAGGLTILLFYIGKWFFDVMHPQGLGRKVSSIKGVLLIALCILILGFMIYVIVQAGSLYIQTSAQQQDSSDVTM